MVINQIDGNLVSPVVFARTTRIQPITVIIAVAVGLSLFGLWGALVAETVAAFIKVLYYDYYQKSRWYRGDIKQTSEVPSNLGKDKAPIGQGKA